MEITSSSLSYIYYNSINEGLSVVQFFCFLIQARNAYSLYSYFAAISFLRLEPKCIFALMIFFCILFSIFTLFLVLRNVLWVERGDAQTNGDLQAIGCHHKTSFALLISRGNNLMLIRIKREYGTRLNKNPK